MHRVLLWSGALALLVCSFPASLLAQDAALQTFTLRETFGATHPDQIVDFDLAAPVDLAQARLLGPDGEEVPCQLLDQGRRLALRTDLPAGAERTWRLVGDRGAAAFPGGVEVRETAAGYEITNGLTGVRLPLPAADPDPVLAPVQGVLLRDGTWSTTGPNLLQARADRTRALQVRFLERGPLKTVVEVAYTFDRPEYRYGEMLVKEAGEGQYTCILTVQAGQPSILFQEDADMDLSWSLDLYEALEPDQARYRGHHARSPESGYEEGGGIYRMWHTRPPLDAFVDLRYDRLYRSSYVTSFGDYPSLRWMAVWDPWVFDSGWYWQIYNRQAPAEAPFVGLFAGRPSQAVGAAFSGTGVFCGTTEEGRRTAGLTVQTNLRAADNRTFPRARYQWGLFAGVKGEDLGPPEEVQNLARQMNLHSGFNLSKLSRWELDFPDPERGYGSLYMSREAMDRMKGRLREDPDFYRRLFNVDAYSRPLLEAWVDDTGEKLRAAVEDISDTAHQLLDALINGDGIYNFGFHYWHGGLQMMRRGVWIDQVLASDHCTEEERRAAKAAAALFANILWDNDFVPLDNPHGLNLGNPNMPVQQWGYRTFYALLLAEHPTMTERARALTDQTLQTARAIINEHGAQIGAVHYIAASLAPTLNSLLQIKQLGEVDPFAEEPRLGKFGEFYMNFLTPPEVRFGNVRKYVSIGDSSAESCAMYGQLATGLRDADPELAARLQGAWISQGRKHSSFFGTTIVMIDEEAPSADPDLGDANFPGWYSVLRHGWGTPNETALWFVNGDFYSDHRHADHGSLVIYALGAPVTVDWGSIYYPHVPAGYMHSMVVPEAAIGYPWDQDMPEARFLRDAARHGTWRRSQLESYLSFRSAAFSQASFQSAGQTWTRRVYSLRPQEAYPAILLRDTFADEEAAGPRVFTLNLMAQGSVDTPVGAITPVERTHPPASETPSAENLPSGGPVFSLPVGLHRLGFTGQYLVDFDLYLLAAEPQQAAIGNWAVTWHQEVRDPAERQHLLRVRGPGSFTALLLPHRKGERRPTEVVAEGENLRLRTGEETLLIGESFYAFHTPARQALAAFTPAPASGAELSVSGGPVEVEVSANTATVTVHGPVGTREVTLPGRWRPADAEAPVQAVGDAWRVTYPGGEPLRVVLVRE